jgi:hypothetical protein
LPRKKPAPIPWEDIPPELEFAKIEPDIVRAIAHQCGTDAARGRALWALVLYYFTGRDDLVWLSGDSLAAFLGLKSNMRRLRAGLLNGKKGGNPRLLSRQSTRQSTDKVRTKYEQSTGAESLENDDSPAETTPPCEGMGSNLQKKREEERETPPPPPTEVDELADLLDW